MEERTNTTMYIAVWANRAYTEIKLTEFGQ